MKSVIRVTVNFFISKQTLKNNAFQKNDLHENMITENKEV